MMDVWILTGWDANDTVIIGVFRTKALAEAAMESEEESYGFYGVNRWSVTQ